MQLTCEEYGVTDFSLGPTLRLLLRIEELLPLVGTWEHRKNSYKIQLSKSHWAS